MWKHTGKERPAFAEETGPGQESVWDYPRPPILVATDAMVEVYSGEKQLAKSSAALRLLETASPPTYYLPSNDVDWSLLVKTEYQSHCEWKGVATYWALASDPTAAHVAWRYENPSERFAGIDNCVSFYPGRVACHVNSERVQAQPGEFYGGWVTKNLAGPFKGDPGTAGW